MTRWLSRFTKTPRSTTDTLDTVISMSRMSVPIPRVFAKNCDPIANEDIKYDHVCTEEHKDMIYEIKSLPIGQPAIVHCYNERAAIFEYEGGLDGIEAEDRAYQFAFLEFSKKNYPKIVGQFEDIIYNTSLTIGGFNEKR